MTRCLWSLALLLAAAGCKRDPLPAVDAGASAARQAPVADAGVPRPPSARAETTVVELHGVRLEDEYAWMKRKGTPELEAWLAAENAYREAVMRPLEPLRRQLVAELRARLKEDDDSARWPMRGYDYWTRTRQGLAYEQYLRAPRDGGPEEMLLDLNAEADGGAFIDVDELEVSDDSTQLAWTIDRTGFREFALQVKDLATGTLGPERIARVDTVAWAADGRTLFYVVENAAKRPYRLYRHVLGTPTERDALVYEEKDERFDLDVSRSSSRRFVLVRSRSLTTAETRVIDARSPTSPPRVVWPRKPEQMYDVEDRGDRFFLRVNDTGRTFRVVSVPITAPMKSKPVEVVPLRAGVMIDEMHLSASHLVLLEREGGLPRLRAIAFDSGEAQDVPLPEADVSLWLDANADFESPVVRFGLTSLVTPATLYDRDLASGRTTLVRQRPVPTYDPSRYETLRLQATAADGTKIPISLARRKGLTGPAPVYLSGYGAYGATNDPSFSSANVSLLERGVIVAEAHVRGGGELGKPWHDAGRLAKKMNTFTDFIACAEFLQREGWTTKDRLIIHGVSAGGLLMGAVLNLRPDLARAAYVEVPFVDVINTMLDESLPLTVIEFEEWGNPKVKADFEVMVAYSPYENVKAQAYPAMLVRSAYNDSQVLFHEPAKWVAKLRATRTDPNPLLLWMEMSPAGHGGRSSRYDALEDQGRELSFLLWQWGLTR